MQFLSSVAFATVFLLSSAIALQNKGAADLLPNACLDLELPEDCYCSMSEREITRKYRSLALKHHPDKSGISDGSKFIKIKASYEKITNHQKTGVPLNDPKTGEGRPLMSTGVKNSLMWTLLFSFILSHITI